MKINQQIPMTGGHSLYIKDFDTKTGVLRFRSSLNPSYVQEDKIVQKGETIYVGMESFPVQFLQKFLEENK